MGTMILGHLFVSPVTTAAKGAVGLQAVAHAMQLLKESTSLDHTVSVTPDTMTPLTNRPAPAVTTPV